MRLLDASFFAPYPGTLALGDYMPGYAVVSVPIVALTGNPVVAHNVLLLLSHAVAALGAAALAARLTGALGPALVAGVGFAYAPRLLNEAYNVQTLAICWFPWLLLTIERALERPTWGRAALAGAGWLGLALASLNVFLYGSVVAALFTAAAVILGGRRVTREHLLPLGLVAVLAVGLLVWVVLAPNRALAREWNLARDVTEIERYSATLPDLAGVPREAVLRRLLGLGADGERAGLVPGVTATALAIAGLVAVVRGWNGLRPALLPYLATLLGTAVLALGPSLATPWGPLSLPYRLLYGAVPGFGALRTPFRFLFFVDLGVALLAAAGVAWVVRRRRGPGRWVVVAALVALLLVESVPVPYPGAVSRLDPAALPAVYRWLATQPPETIALGIPMGDWANIAAAAFHLRRTVNGWSSYLPPHYLALADAMERFPDPRSLALAQGAGVDVVLVDRAWLTPARTAALSAVPSLLRAERAFPTHMVYRLSPAPGALGRVEAEAAVAPGQACVTLRNPGPGFVPLYPLHRLHLAVEGGGDEGLRWLPVDLAPGGVHTACVGLPAPRPPLRIRGEVENGARVYRFAVSAEGGAQRLERVR